MSGLASDRSHTCIHSDSQVEWSSLEDIYLLLRLFIHIHSVIHGFILAHAYIHIMKLHIYIYKANTQLLCNGCNYNM